ncbi:MAG TPA: ComEC/Rec2 family competence protein [Gaiellaceae bacterium]|nr:ComEC/Rec2 family competence protein [Gaiellaceae bacterium]
MSRLLPAQAVLGAGALGLALADLARPRGGALLLLALAPASLLLLRAPQLAVAACAAACLGWWWGALRLDALDRSVLRADIGRAGDVDAVTTADPRPGRFDVRQFARALSFDGTRVDEPVELELPLGRAPPQGARVRLLARVAAPRGPSHGFDERGWLRRQGIHVVLRVDRLRVVGRRGGLGGIADRLRSWLRRDSTAGLSGERRALIAGIVLGDGSGLSDGLKQAFRRAGLYHLLAVSGQNVVLLSAGVLCCCVLLGVPRWCGHLGAVAAIGVYVLAVGPQPSVVRAAVSGGAVSVGWLLGRTRDGWHALLLAAVALLGWSPYALLDPGFQLSFVAVAAIFVLGGPLARELEGYPLPGRFRAPVAIAVACGLATAPVLWLQFGQVPLLGVLSNALVELVVGPLLGLAFTTALASLAAPSLAALLAWPNGLVAAYVAGCARVVGGLPAAQVSGREAALAAVCALAGSASVLRWLRRA